MSRHLREAALGTAAWVVATILHGAPSTTLVVVYKNPAPGRAVESTLPPFAPVSSQEVGELGFSLIADYESRAVYEGPTATASKLVEELQAAGSSARIATDLEEIHFNDATIHLDDWKPMPSSPGTQIDSPATDALYLVALRSYPLQSWIKDLDLRGVRLVEALPPASFLVRFPRQRVEELQAKTSYVAALIPVTPSLKRTLFQGIERPNGPWNVFIQTAERPDESILSFLMSIDPEATEERDGDRRSYRAQLTDVDIETLTHFDLVYSVSPIGVAEPASERQGVLALQPTFTSGRQEVAPTSPNYYQLLQNKGITDFSNTKIAIIDTGFDNGVMSGGNVHPDFTTSGQLECLSGTAAVCQDLFTHGTPNASVIAGYADFGSRSAGFRADNGQYRYGLGLAPKCHLIIANNYGLCSLTITLAQMLMDPNFQSRQPHVINYSFANNGQTGYDSDSLLMDKYTRLKGWLFTVAAGNAVTGQPAEVRAPATAKNVIAVGATETYTNITGTAGSWPKMSPPLTETCKWAGYSPWGPPEGNFTPEDARNIPTYSPTRRSASDFALKPDLVAPGSRVTGPLSRNAGCQGFLTVFCNKNIDQFFVGSGLQFSYGFSAGTSLSAPAIAGAAAVVRKWYRNIRGIDPSPAMTKAILINGARDISGGLVRAEDFVTAGSVTHITADNRQGWGSLNFDRLLGASLNYYTKDQSTTLQAGVSTYWETVLTVRDGSKPIRITLVYTDAPSAVSTTTYKVKNDLTVGAYQTACFPCWYGNNINASTGLSAPNASVRDHVNNVEEIIIPASYYSTGATLRVFVNADNLVADGLNPDNLGTPFRQDFALFVDNLN